MSNDQLSSIKVKPVQGRDCQAPELVAHLAAQDTVRHGHRLLKGSTLLPLSLLNPREPACVVAEWHRRDIRRRGHRVRPRVRIISLGRAGVRVRAIVLVCTRVCRFSRTRGPRVDFTTFSLFSL
eukprot:scaffold78198_cov55-Phaeocystis_antarctica.AAC.1